MPLILDRSSSQTLIAFGDDTLTLDGRDDTWVAKLRTFLQGRRPNALAVGLGPGSFAGIRAAIACLQGMGIGWGLQPKGYPSAALYALASGLTEVTVVGDARRGTLWAVDYHVTEAQLIQTSDFRLHSAETFSPTDTMVSPDAKRLERFGLRAVNVTAEHLMATYRRLDPALITADPLPIYLHPAVGMTQPTH